MTKDNVQKLGGVLRTLDRIMLTTLDQSGHLVSRPMALRVDTFDGSLVLFAPIDSRVIANIRADPKVNISYTGSTTSLSVAGKATFSPNRDRVAARWHPGLDSWFPGGPKGVAVIEVAVEEARIWSVTEQEHSPSPMQSGMRQVDAADLARQRA